MPFDPVVQNFIDRLPPEHRQVFLSLSNPAQIQAFLDTVAYNPAYENRSPAGVLNDRLAHCLDGGFFAAAALRALGHPPLLIDLFPDPGMDDDHVLAIYQVNGRWGCVAKSNFVGLRSREPVYRSLRELVMSYFDPFYNLNGVKSLRTYTRPIHLAAYDRLNWMWDDSHLDVIEKRMLSMARIPVLPPGTAEILAPTDPLTYKAGMLVANPDGIYKPRV
jgi:hypothetical protein